jgi:hypothetical protein
MDTESLNFSENIWKYVLLRWYYSWVHFWKLESAKPWMYVLSESRRLFRYWCKKWISLSWVSQYWLADRREVKICWIVPRIEIVDPKISEILPCSEEAIKSIKEYKEYDPN